MQNYLEINGQDYVKDSRTKINESLRTLLSNNSGTAFPTSNLQEGMKCFRTDLGKTFTLIDAENDTWIDDSIVTKLAQAVTIALSGGATGTATEFDGSGNIVIPVTSIDASAVDGTVEKATKDSANQQIDSTYIKDIAINGTTVTITKGNGTTSTQTTQDNNTTYSAATTSAAGLMSASDKAKLDGIAAGANNFTYTLPDATSSVKGGVKIGSNITVSSGVISLVKANITSALGYTPPTTNTTYGVVTSSQNGLMSPAMLALLGSGGGITAASLSANGYVKFANGLILQWGMVPIGASSFTVYFPITFPSAVYSITNATIIQPALQSYGGPVADVTLSSFTLRRWSTDRGAYWMAFGK